MILFEQSRQIAGHLSMRFSNIINSCISESSNI